MDLSLTKQKSCLNLLEYYNPNANWNTLMSDTEKKLALRELVDFMKDFEERH